jgi:hypothetical protein
VVPPCFRLVRWLVLAGAVCAPSTALAYRPFDGTDADVAEPGRFEIEMGPAYASGFRERTILALPSLVLNQGIVPGWELVAEGTNAMSVERGTQHGLQLVDTGLSVKTILVHGSLQDQSGPSVASEIGPLLPTLGAERTFGAQGTLIVSQRWTPLSIHVNGGAVYTRAATHQLVSSVIIEGPASFRVRPVMELLAADEVRRATTYSMLVGAIWKTSDTLALDLGVRGGILDGASTEEVRVGLTWALPLWGAGATRMNQTVGSR